MSSRLLRQTLALIALAFLPAIGQAIYFKDKVSWQSPIPASESVKANLARGWGASAIWVDARPEEEFASEHVPGALPLNEDRWNELLPPVLSAWSPEKKVVVYCSSQDCNSSRDIARRLRTEAQLKDTEGKNCVFVLEGGWEEWLKTK